MFFKNKKSISFLLVFVFLFATIANVPIVQVSATTMEQKEVSSLPVADVTPPTPKTGLAYNGTAQELVTPGTAEGGILLYSIDGEETYSPNIPKATNAGTYEVFYYASGDATHSDSAPLSISVLIAEVAPTLIATPTAIEGLVYNGSYQKLVNVGTAEGGTIMYILPGDSERTNSPMAREVGTYLVSYYIKGDLNHSNTTEVILPVTIASNGKENAQITAAPIAKEGLDYNGTAQELIVPGSAEGGILLYSIDNGTTYSPNIPKGTNAGIYQVLYYVSADALHNEMEDKNACSSTINKVAPTFSVQPTALSLTYTGVAQTLVSTGDSSCGTWLYKCGAAGQTTFSETIPMATAAGTYLIELRLMGDANHTNIFYFPDIWTTIEKKDTFITVSPEGKQLTYTGEEQALVSPGEANAGTVMYRVVSGWSEEVPTRANIGTYIIEYYIQGDANHNNSSDIWSVTATIEEATGGSAEAPIILTQPQNTEARVNTEAIFSIMANTPEDGGTLSYQWYYNTTGSNSSGVEIPDGANSSARLARPDAITVYVYCVVTNTKNGQTATTRSNVVTATYYIPTESPHITAQPQNTEVPVNTQARFSIRADAIDGGTLSYQWYYYNTTETTIDATSISGGTNSSVDLTASDAKTLYVYCVVTNTINGRAETTISDIVMAVYYIPPAAPVITAQPEDAQVPIDTEAVFSLAVNEPEDGGTLSYQWYFNSTGSNTSGTAISNGMSSSVRFVIPATTLYFYCVVTNTKDGRTTITKSDIATAVGYDPANPPVATDEPSEPLVPTPEPSEPSVPTDETVEPPVATDETVTPPAKDYTGWHAVDDSYYYYVAGELVKNKWFSVEGPSGQAKASRYFTSSGKLAGGWTDITSDGKTDKYYFWYSTYGSTCAKGLQKNLTAWSNGEEGRTYYFDSDGKMQTAWKYVQGSWRYFDDELGWAPIGWTNIERDGTTYVYYFWSKADGTYAKGGLTAGLTAPAADGGAKNQTYYFDSQGHRQTGFQLVKGTWYYFDDVTGIAPTLWKSIERGGETHDYYFWSNKPGLYAKNGSWTLSSPDADVQYIYTFNAKGQLTGYTSK